MINGSGQIIALAGATGDLGRRIANALTARGATVRALLRTGTPEGKLAAVRRSGATPVVVDFDNSTALQEACTGAACVVSVLNGLEPVIIGVQTQLLQAAVSAGVPRFMPSDFSLDFTKTRPGDNRNMDLRRAFQGRIDAAPIKAQSVLNGMFTDLITGQAPIIMHKQRRVLYWGDVDQKLDLTTKDDVADFAADVALDAQAPRFSRIAGSAVSTRELAAIMTRLTGTPYKPFRPGGLTMFSAVIALVRTLTPRSDDAFPAWQGMQYMRDMLSGRGKLSPLDNNRYGKTD
ncbi:NmrA family NAD(P)-binding protein [Devosia aurantiaca]|uniref:NmrA family NAD(P)-binding protein n=1 Tax=Devosia aurantiaca TaxID=2714858 RepID=A0A6M1SIK6_9HYPH|nr:NmrA family NAD(P)-binding protein [Devosia aurantiaca]NGP17018.1 NmrA family NAD(P)-binding protein [Devosia aurantiaca]